MGHVPPPPPPRDEAELRQQITQLERQIREKRLLTDIALAFGIGGLFLLLAVRALSGG